MNVATAKAYTYETVLQTTISDAEKAAAERADEKLKKILDNAKQEPDICEHISKAHEEACERARKRNEKQQEEEKKEREQAIKKARRKALYKQQMIKKEELRDLYERMADKRREYSRYLNESSLEQAEAFNQDVKRPRSINVRAVKSYESSFTLAVKQELGV